MEIKFLKIYGYGKWIDKKFQLSPNFHVFYGENETGKTTLMSFIHSVLFGFPSRNSQKLRYEPKESSRYGGQIGFEDHRLGNGTIKRVAGKSSGDVEVTLENGTVGEDELAKELMHNIDRNLYQQLFSFHLEDLETIRQLNSEDINRYFVSVGVLGSKDYMSLADQLEQEAAKLYKPSGRVPEINKQLKDLNKQNNKLMRAKEKNNDYLSLVKEIESINDSLEEINKKQNYNSQKLEQLKQIEKDWEVKLEMNKLEKEIKQITIPQLPEDGLYQLRQINSDIEKVHEKQRSNQKKLQEHQREHQPSEMYVAYEENKSVVQKVNTKMPYLLKKQKELNELKVEKKYLSQNLSKDIAKENLDEQSKLPVIWNNVEDKRIEQWNAEMNKIEEIISENQKEYDYISYQIDSDQNEIDDLEKRLDLSNDLNKGKDSFEKTPNTKYTQYLLAGGSALGITGSILFSSNIRWVFMFITAVLVFLFFYQIKKNQEKSSTNDENNEAHSQDLKNIWRNKLAQMDAYIERQNELKTYSDSLQESRHLLENKWKQFKKNNFLPLTLVINNAMEKKEKYKEIYKMKNQVNKLTNEIEKIEEEIEKAIEHVQFIYEFFPVQQNIDSKLQSINYYMNKINNEEQYLEEYIRESEYIQKELSNLYKEKETYFDNKVALLQSVNAKSEDAFRELFEQKSEKERKRSRLNYLKEKYQFLKNMKDFNKLSDVQNKIAEYEKTRQQLSQKEREMIKSKAEINYDVKKLEEGYEFTTLLQDFENEKNNLQELVQKWATKKVASLLIKNTLNYGTEDQLPQVLKDAEKYLSLLTDGKYKSIYLTEDGIKINNSTTSFYASELSRGTAEPLYVALRFGFIKNISQTLALPILVDDGFVNFDENRKEAVYKLLKEMSQYVQILYFTFDDKITDYVDQSQITVLK